jgi:DNA gyrase subunit B
MSYDANSIQTLSFSDAVRQRISMYMGSADNQGVLQCIREIITNCIDEATVGYCSRIFVDLYEGNHVTVLDNGRGCPFGARDDGIDALEAIYTLPHSGGKFNDKTYQNVAGMNGIGAKGVALSSDKFRAVSMRDGKQCELILEKGKKVSLKTTEGEGRGTFVDFTPSPEVYNLEPISIKFSDIKEMCRNWSYLYPSLTFILNNHIKGEEETVEYHAKNGLLDFMTTYAGKSLNKTPLHIVLAEDGIEAEIVMCWTNNRNEEFYVFTNGLENVNGGTSLTGVKTALTNYFKKKVKGDVSPDVLRKGLFYAVSCKVPNPSFSDQTKTKVNTPALRGLCQRATSQMLGDFEKKHTDEFQKILELLLKEVKAEAAAEKARRQVLETGKEVEKNQKRKVFASDKLKDAEFLGQDSTLLLVEGLSAASSVAMARDEKHFGILALRGKMINAFSNDEEKFYQNEEVKLLLSAMNIIPGRYDSKKLRYGKVGILTDEDSDGKAIALLIMCALYKVAPELINEGRLCWMRSPLYIVKNGKKETYYYDDKELQEAKDNGFIRGEVQRNKGLGSLSAEQAHRSMFTPEFQRIDTLIPDAATFDVLYSLMGKDSEPKHDFIFNNIDFSEIRE